MDTISSWIRGVTCKVYADTSVDQGVQATLLEQHAAIVAAIRAGDAPAAREAMAAHLRFAEETAHRADKPAAAGMSETP
jgi:DNA-binding FadR family transcriptional regulator